MSPNQAIRFHASFLHWRTRAEASHGCFQLEAVLEWWPAPSRSHRPFVLAASVPAGRMYATDGPLLRQPSYSFQLIAGEQEHTILRRWLDANDTCIPHDTSHPHSAIFEDLSWHLNHCSARKIQPEALAALPAQALCLNLILEWRRAEGLLRLQSPVRHWNHRPDPFAWQIETGPLLWPMDLTAFAAAPHSSALTTAWLHANRSGHVTLSGDRLPCHELEAQLSLLALIE